MGKGLLSVRDADQKDRLMPITRIRAEDVCVPVVGLRTVLHQMTVRIIGPGRLLRHHLREPALRIVDEGAFGPVPYDIGRVDHNMPGAQLVGW